MFLELAIAATIQTSPARAQPNTLAVPNNIYDRWPGAGFADDRWTLHAPAGLAPFFVATKAEGPQIAVRWVAVPERRETYYVATRQTADRLEEADSRTCEFAPLVHGLRQLPLPEILVPGSMPVQHLAGPPQPHQGIARLTVFGARQPGGQRSDLTVTAQEGTINEWINNLFAATESCWKPITAPG